MIANVNTKKIIVIVASTHFLLVLALLAILKGTGFTLITLFGSPPRPTRFQSLVFDLFGVLLYPMCLVEMPKTVPENWFTIGLWAFVFNSVIWGFCLSLAIHAVRQRFRKAPTDLSRPGGVATASAVSSLPSASTNRPAALGVWRGQSTTSICVYHALAL